MKIPKNRKELKKDIKQGYLYEPLEAIKILKDKSYVKFDETIDVAINLTIDTNKSDQNIKGVLNLPNGSGKKIKVAVLASSDKHQEAKDSNADIVGAEDLIVELETGKFDFDLLIATPDMMPSLGKVAKVLGPKGLMPNPKMGTVTKDIGVAVKNAKSGQIKFKNDKSGIVHAGIVNLVLMSLIYLKI